MVSNFLPTRLSFNSTSKTPDHTFNLELNICSTRAADSTVVELLNVTSEPLLTNQLKPASIVEHNNNGQDYTAQQKKKKGLVCVSHCSRKSGTYKLRGDRLVGFQLMQVVRDLKTMPCVAQHPDTTTHTSVFGRRPAAVHLQPRV